MPSPTRANDPVGIAQRILVLRGQRVLLDSDLAELYCVQTERLNHQVRRNPRYPPLAFTEHGAIMAVTVLNSPRALEMSVYVVRAFVKLRKILASNTELARKLQALERSVATLDARTRKHFEGVYTAIRALMAPAAPKSRLIGFTADLDRHR